jgi:hypothetical protein
MIGKKRSGKYPVYCYDPTTRSKVYVGSREKLADARTLEAEERVKRKKRGKTTWTVEQFAARWFDAFHGPGTRRPEYTTRKVHEGTLKQLLKDFGPRRLDSIERDEALDWARQQPEGRVKVVARSSTTRSVTARRRRTRSRSSGSSSPAAAATSTPSPSTRSNGSPTSPGSGGWTTASWPARGSRSLRGSAAAPAEMFGLTWDDLDFKAGTVAIDRQLRVDGEHLPKRKRTGRSSSRPGRPRRPGDEPAQPRVRVRVA